MDWKPPTGLLTLIEPLDPEPGREGLTGVVVDGSTILIDLGASPRPTAAVFDGAATFFTPEAMYRITGVFTATGPERSVYELMPKKAQRVQRRNADRFEVTVPVSLSALDGPGPLLSVPGETCNVSSGGCRVLTERPFPPGTDPTVSIDLGEDSPVVARAVVLEHAERGGRFDYRLVFTDIDLDDRVRLAALASN